MNEKKKCPNCGLLIDEDMEKCPYCGFLIENKKEDKTVSTIKSEEPKEVIKDDKMKQRWITFAERKDVNTKKEIFLFLFMVVGLSLISLFVQILTSFNNSFFLKSQTGEAMINFSIYLIAFGICLFVIGEDLLKIVSKFKNGRTYLYGIGYGFLLIIASAVYSSFSQLVFGNVGSNNNESSIDSIVANFPFLSIIVFSFLGPICEEFGYRLGLFSFLRRHNRIVAYIVSAIIFGFIHFDFESFANLESLKVELINIPSYIISGLILCYVYDKEGIETSITCHITNNLVAIILTIISLYL